LPLVLLASAVLLRAQTPVLIDVTSLSIDKPYISSAGGVMTATGLPALYKSPLSGRGGPFSFENSRPCYFGTTFVGGFGSEPPGSFLSGFLLSG
jgi:hypothetical protein